MGDVHTLPELLTEDEVARRLGMHPATLARMRRAGYVPRYRKPGRGRSIRYTEDDVEALKASMLVISCDDTVLRNDSKLADSGSAAAATVPLGAEPGSILTIDRLAAHRLAQTTLKTRS